jgi:hypothetical protein
LQLPWAQEASGSNPDAPTKPFQINESQKGNFGAAALWCDLATIRTYNNGQMTPLIETSAPNYDWMNLIIAIGTGYRRADGPIHSVFEVL